MTNRTISPLRQRMVEDMNARQLGPHSQRSHIYSCERFASFLKRSPDNERRLGSPFCAAFPLSPAPSLTQPNHASLTQQDHARFDTAVRSSKIRWVKRSQKGCGFAGRSPRRSEQGSNQSVRVGAAALLDTCRYQPEAVDPDHPPQTR
jgi:hypothetical protein